MFFQMVIYPPGCHVFTLTNLYRTWILRGWRVWDSYREYALHAPLWYKSNTLQDMIIAREAKTKHQFGDKPYLSFEHVTMVPMCRKLIDETLLTKVEKEWLNTYHEEIFSKTKGFFEGSDARSMAWLKRESAPI
jgi:hypothetical protein